MMSPLMPALDAAANTSTSLATACPDVAASQGFSALIQGLQPELGMPEQTIPAPATALPLSVPAVSVSTDSVADDTMLADQAAFLHELGLGVGQTSPVAKLDSSPEVDIKDAVSAADVNPQPQFLINVMPLTEAMKMAPVHTAIDTPDPAMLAQAGAKPSITQLPMAAAFLNMSSTIAVAPRIDDSRVPTGDALAGNLLADILKPAASAISFALPASPSISAAPVLTSLLPHAVQDPAWADAFGQRVALLAQQGTQSVTLQLNPLDLGPIQVRIAMSEQGAKVEFNTLQQTTSDLIKAAMPRLAAALEYQGLRLDDARVNLLTTRQDVFSATSAFSPRQDAPQSEQRGEQQSERGQLPQTGRGRPDTASERDTGLLETREISLLARQKAGIDYYA